MSGGARPKRPYHNVLRRDWLRPRFCCVVLFIMLYKNEFKRGLFYIYKLSQYGFVWSASPNARYKSSEQPNVKTTLTTYIPTLPYHSFCVVSRACSLHIYLAYSKAEFTSFLHWIWYNNIVCSSQRHTLNPLQTCNKWINYICDCYNTLAWMENRGLRFHIFIYLRFTHFHMFRC